MLKKLIVLILFVLGSSIGLIACTPTPPCIIMQNSFSSAMDIFPDGAPVYVLCMNYDEQNHYMFRCYVKGEDVADFGKSAYDIGNIYFICYSPYMSYDYYVKKDKYSVCTDDPSEKNPEFAQFLKDNHWGEKYTDYEKLYEPAELPTLFEEKDSELLNELAEKMAELAVGKKSGKTESYVLGEIRSNYVSGIYYYGDFDLENMTMKFIRINITEEMLKEYKENGTVSSHGISVEDFDPYRYSEYVNEINRNT